MSPLNSYSSLQGTEGSSARRAQGKIAELMKERDEAIAEKMSEEAYFWGSVARRGHNTSQRRAKSNPLPFFLLMTCAAHQLRENFFTDTSHIRTGR